MSGNRDSQIDYTWRNQKHLKDIVNFEPTPSDAVLYQRRLVVIYFMTKPKRERGRGREREGEDSDSDRDSDRDKDGVEKKSIKDQVVYNIYTKDVL